MGTRLKNKNIRKIARIGNRSLGITLPVEFLDELGWREKQRVTVNKVRGRLVIADWRPKRKKR